MATRLPRRLTSLSVVLTLVACAALVAGVAAGQRGGTPPAPVPDNLPDLITALVEAERGFAARAVAVGWKQAFLEFFADSAVGFEDGAVGYAKDQIAKNPDPPPDFQLLWEPRYGDLAASGDIGFLTGPSRTILPSRDSGRARHTVYASVWKRQRDGTYKVVLDVGVPTPRAAVFAPGFTRAPHASRFTGDFDERTPPLAAADGVLNSALRSSQSRAYRGRLAPGARLHRPNLMPLTTEPEILAWLARQPVVSASDTRFSESSLAGDLGYTWGTYIIPARQQAARQEGFYVRVWVRSTSRQWTVLLDVLQPQ